MTHAEILELADKIATGVATDEDIVEFNSLLSRVRGFETRDENLEDLKETEHVLQQRIWRQIGHDRPSKVLRVRWMIWSLAAAAVLVGVTILGPWFFRPKGNLPKSIPDRTTKNDIVPGREKATLQLSDGRLVSLDSVGTGLVAMQGSSQVFQSSHGELSYKHKEAPGDPAMLYNILITPRAGQFRLILPDGTRVWLNNASMLRYPTAFSGKDRVVELTGEAYFEVAEDKSRPFRVAIGKKDGIVEVLGTHFNVTAYPDEASIKTTLLEGSVRFSRDGRGVVVRPGQQAVAGRDGSLSVGSEADAIGAIAWKNGYFHFSHADLTAVLRQLARWYDIDVRYEGNIQAPPFGGDIQRNLPLEQVLAILSESQVHFRLIDRTLLVRP